MKPEITAALLDVLFAERSDSPLMLAIVLADGRWEAYEPFVDRVAEVAVARRLRPGEWRAAVARDSVELMWFAGDKHLGPGDVFRLDLRDGAITES